MQGLGVAEFVLYITYRWPKNYVALEFVQKYNPVKVHLSQKLHI